MSRRQTGLRRRRILRTACFLTGLGAGLLALVPGAMPASPTGPASSAASIPNPGPYPYILGVNTHHSTGHGNYWVCDRYAKAKYTNFYGYVVEDTLKAFSDLGFSAMRIGVPWNKVSGLEFPSDGSGFPPRHAPLKQLLDGLPRGTFTLFNVSAANDDVNKGEFPVTEAARQDYAAHAAAAAILTNSWNPYLEIWNEWDLGGGTHYNDPENRVGGTAESYVDLVKVAAPAIRRANPNAKVVAGAHSLDLGLKWTEEAILEHDLLDYADVLSVHVYAHCGRKENQGAQTIIRRLEELGSVLEKARGPGKFPVFVSETGFPGRSFQWRCGFNDDERAAHTAQLMLWLPKLDFVKGIWFYELKNKLRPNDKRYAVEDKFGLLDFHYQPKPSICSFRDTASFLRSAKFKRQNPRTDGIIEMIYDLDGIEVQALWDPDPIGRSGPIMRIPANKKAYYICEGHKPYPDPKLPPAQITQRPLLVMPANHPWEPPSANP